MGGAVDAGGWRERDPGRRAPAAPASVAGVVRTTHRTLRGARVVEGALLGCAAGFVLLAARVLDSGIPDPWADGRTWLLAFLCGLLVAASWVLSHRISERAVARALDRRLRFHGALLTALDVEGSRAPMGRLVVDRVRARLRTREAMRALFPPLLLPIALPIAGFAIFVGTREAVREPEVRGAHIAAAGEGLARIFEGLGESAAKELDPASAGALDELVRRARDLARRAEVTGEARAVVPREASALRAGLDALARSLADDPAGRDALDRARSWLDTLEKETGASTPRAGADAALGGGGETPTEEASRNSVETPGAQVTGSEPGGTMPAAAAPVPAQGVGGAAGTFWPREYDGVVSAWLSSLSEGAAPPPSTSNDE